MTSSHTLPFPLQILRHNKSPHFNTNCFFARVEDDGKVTLLFGPTAQEIYLKKVFRKHRKSFRAIYTELQTKKFAAPDYLQSETRRALGASVGT